MRVFFSALYESSILESAFIEKEEHPVFSYNDLWWLDASQPERTNRSIAKAVRIDGHWCDKGVLGPKGVRK